MATLSRAESKDMYSWWWDSHISPKNSKWLQENLSDMDGKVKTMIKLIEVDEDSFARRAELYYKKRPELMKLVEEFYRAYRALAERYDNATGVIRQAHRTMEEAFPNQVPFLTTDDGPVNVTHDSDPHTPEMRAPLRASFDPDELQKGEVGLPSSDFLSVRGNGDFTKGLKQLNGFGKARKGLNFNQVEEKGESTKKNDHVKAQVLSESERLGRSETDIQALKEALGKLEVEKEAGVLQYEQTLERLSKLESEVSQAKENSKGLNERASKAEAEVQSLKETLAKVEAEREASILQYQQCLDRISNLESQLNDQACKAEKETELLKEELTPLKAEKETFLANYMQALEKIANLENKLLLAADYASRTSDRADRAEKEVETLRETVTRLTEEKETAVFNYEQCLGKIAVLEREIILFQEEAERLKAEVQDEAAKLKGSEEQCLLLESELDTFEQKVANQNQELSDKQKELGRLWACVQEERMRFMEAETGFQSLQNLHSKVQEELRSVASELQKKVQLLKNVEIQNQHLEDEVQKANNENKDLNDLNLSASVSIKAMKDEILNLKEGKGKLEQQLELRLDQRNTLQQEFYCLKEELSNLRLRYRDVMGQVKSVGLDPESFGSSVKELRDENSKLKETCYINDVEIASLAEKLSVMEKLLEKKELLENSLSDLEAELEGARENVMMLEESCQLLMGEKATLITQLQITTKNLENLSERNTFLENSLFDANAKLEMLSAKLKNLEDTCWLLNDQNSVLVEEKQTLASQLETTQQRLEDLGKRHVDLELRYSGLEEERKSTLRRVEELRVCLDVEKQEHANSGQLSQTRIADLENQIRVLQEEGDHMKEEFEEELDKAVNAQFDIFILQKCIHDLKDENSSLRKYCEKLLEASKLSEKLTAELEHTSLEQEEEVRVLTSQTKGLRTGMFWLLEALETELGPTCDGCNDEDQRILQHILDRLDNIKTSLSEAWDENQELVIQKSVLLSVLWQLKKDVADLNGVIIILGQVIGSRNEQLLVMQREMQKLLEGNEELILKVREGNQKEAVLLSEMEILREKLFNLQSAYEDLQNENCKVIEDKESLIKAFEDLEHECSCITGEAVALENLSFVFKNVIFEKVAKVIELTENIDTLCNENVSLEVSLKKSGNELEEARALNDNLEDELALKEMKLLEVEAIKVTQEKQIFKLSENYDQKFQECESLGEFIEHLDSQMSKMCKEYEETEARTVVLSSELQKGKDEVKLWETVAGSFFTELQSSSVREALIKEKHSELIKEYEILEEESYSKCMDIVQLRERVGALEGENSDMKTRLAADYSAILSLRDSVASLEKHTVWNKKLHKTDNEDNEDGEHCQNLSKDEVAATQLSGSVDLQEVQARIQAVEKAVIELKQHAEEECSTVRSDLDSAMRQLDVLKSQSGSRRGSGRSSKRFASHSQEDLKNGSSSNVSERADELLMKDIVLDQVSDSSSYGRNRRIMGSDDQILELWETIDQGGSIDLTVGKPYRSSAVSAAVPNKFSHLEAVKENKSGRPSSESTIDKELCVDDQLETSKRFLNPHQDGYKKTTLERLASDVQKLTNLQITVQDLKEKLVMTETSSSKGKGVECDGIKDQLIETDETISKLFDYSGKLMKKIEKSSSTASSFDGSIAADSSDGGSSRRRRCSEQARRISEKIGRLQLEVQKVQFLLMKLDNNNKAGKGGARITERNTRILLRDYLYSGGSRTPRRRKRTHFCGCVQPPTKGD